MNRTLLLLVLTAPFFANGAEAQTVISSPEGHNTIAIAQHDDEFFYTISRNGQSIVTDSRLGLDLDNHTWERTLARKYPQYKCWMNGFTVDSVKQSAHHDTIHNLYGEQATAPDNYNAATIFLSKHDGSSAAVLGASAVGWDI